MTKGVARDVLLTVVIFLGTFLALYFAAALFRGQPLKLSFGPRDWTWLAAVGLGAVLNAL